jgi:hypothetical protein
VLVLDELAWPFSLSLFTERLRRGGCDSSLVLFHLDRSLVSDFIKHILRSEFVDSALRVDSAVQHAH